MATATRTVATWSPARIYLVATGILLIGAGLVGFGLSTSFPSSAEAAHSADNPHIYGIFETNGWHNLTTLISGAISLSFALRPEWARTGAFVKGTLYATVTITIALWGPGVVASNDADQVVHGSLAVAAFAAAFATPSITNLD